MKKSIVAIFAIIALSTLILGSVLADPCPPPNVKRNITLKTCWHISDPEIACNRAYWGSWLDCEPAPDDCYCVVEFVESGTGPMPGSGGSLNGHYCTYMWYHCCWPY